MNQLAQQGLVVLEGRATYERIASYIREVEPEEAARQVQNFLKIYPEFAQAHNDLAVLYYQSGNGMKALAHYEKAHKLDPTNITFRKNLADFYFVELEWSDDAIHTYLDILKDNPFDIESLNALGTISLQVGRKEQARQYFTRTLQLDTVNSQARQALQQLGGQLPAVAQQARIAEPTYSSMAPQFQQPSVTPIQPPPPPMTPEQIHRRALDQMNAGNASEAQHLLQELILLYPGYAVAHNDLGVMYQQGGDFVRAKHHQAEALRLQPENVNFQKNLADLLYIGCGETEEALRLYVKILGSNPRDIETLSALSAICLETGNTEDARSFLESILRADPWNTDARETLAKISQPVDQRGEKELYAEALQHVQNGQFIEAQEMLEELAHVNSGNALYHNDLGVVRYQLGDIAGAQRAYEKSVELEPGNSTFSKNLADLYFSELGMTDEAIHIYIDLFKQSPRDVETLSNLGHISAAIGRPQEAQSFYRRVLEIEPWNVEVRELLQTSAIR